MKRLINADSWALKSWRSVQCAPTKEVCRMWTECTAPPTHLQYTCNTCAYYHEIVAISAVEVCFQDTHTFKDTPATHLQHTCNTPATHLQHTCNTCASYSEIVALCTARAYEKGALYKNTPEYTCNTPATHLQHMCKSPCIIIIDR